MKVSLQNRRINEKTRNYNSQSHLHQIAERYNHTARILMSPYEGWYNFQIPNITFRSVKKELLTIAEVSAILGFCTDTVRTLLGNGGHSCFLVGNRELILRSELREVLKRFAPNGIRDYPD